MKDSTVKVIMEAKVAPILTLGPFQILNAIHFVKLIDRMEGKASNHKTLSRYFKLADRYGMWDW